VPQGVSGALSSEATAIDAEHLDAFPAEQFPAAAVRTQGPPHSESATMSADKINHDPEVAKDYPHAPEDTRGACRVATSHAWLADVHAHAMGSASGRRVTLGSVRVP
jgi:hypothetical protein